MSKEHLTSEEKKAMAARPDRESHVQDRAADTESNISGLAHLQNQVGNRAVQRLLVQRSGEGAFELDDETAGRINQERGGGQPLDGGLQAQLGQTMGVDFSGVRVHTSPEADRLNQQLSARAFTTGQDVFFREGAYQPHSGSGQELVAHELTHVIQQGAGAVQGGSGMTVNAPGDAFEQEADAVASEVTSAANTTEAEGGVQRQAALEEEEEEVQMQALEDEEEVQRQELQEEEEGKLKV